MYFAYNPKAHSSTSQFSYLPNVHLDFSVQKPVEEVLPACRFALDICLSPEMHCECRKGRPEPGVSSVSST